MTTVFELVPDDHGWGRRNRQLIEAVHFRSMPGVRCPKCGSWALSGLMYPSIAPAVIEALPIPVDSSPVSLAEFKRIHHHVQPILGTGRPVKPGTTFGPLRGRARGDIGDFTWLNPWTPMVSESIWHLLLDHGFDTVGETAQLTFHKPTSEPLVELEVRPAARLPRSMVPSACDICDRLPIKTPEKLAIDASTFDGSIPIQRVMELPTILLVNQELAEFIQSRGLSNAVLRRVELI